MPHILYCRCAYAQVIPEPVKNAHLEQLCDSGEEFRAVPDLCEMAAARDPRLAELAGRDDLRIIACHPRAVKGLFTQAGCPLSGSAEIINMREVSPAT
jgi:hypothetical protein